LIKEKGFIKAVIAIVLFS